MSPVLNPRIVSFPGIRLAALGGPVSFADDRTPAFWQSFSRIRGQFRDRFAPGRYSVSAYPAGFFDAFDPAQAFSKWAAAPLLARDLPVPALQWLDIPPGVYAVFSYQGRAADAAPFFRAIFTAWLPRSGYRLDVRPHFELLPEDYRPDDTQATEAVYIPVTGG